jgi:hypothetical protein
MPRKDFAELFEAEGQGARELLEELKDGAVDALDLAIEEIPDTRSKRKKLQHIKDHAFPLILRQLESRGVLALMEPTKTSDVLAAIDDIAAGSKVKVAALKTAIEEEARRRLVNITSESRAAAEAESAKNAVPEDNYAPLLNQGVLERYVADAARMHGVVGDEEPMKLLTLVAVGAQLDLLPNQKPLGPSTMLIGEAGRGKNYLTDAVVGPLPPDWYLAFESASAASMYYQVENDPDFLTHRFVYPNEAEATDMLVEFLRPMLSAGKAVRLTVNNTGANGANEAQELVVRGPITTIIPTVRNKLDEQLQTRLLVAELENYEGRIRKHARAFSRLLLPGYATADNTESVRNWMAALRSLTEVRRVVFPLDREEFALDNDGISHGPRLWANLLGLMCSHAWLEQRNREVIELASGERAIVATPDDYEAAYHVFATTSQRTVVNLSDTHRRILDALYELEQNDPDSGGFSQRVIAEHADISQPAVAKHKAFLTMSVKLIRETDHGLALVSGAEASWWSGDDLMRGFPSPEKVREWYEEVEPPDGQPPRNSRDRRNHRDHPESDNMLTPHDNPENGRNDLAGPVAEGARDRDHDPITKHLTYENSLDKPNIEKEDKVITPITASTGMEGEENAADAKNGSHLPLFTAEDALVEMNIANSGPAKTAAVYGRGQTSFEYLVKAVLNARGLAMDDWERHIPVIEVAFERWEEES